MKTEEGIALLTVNPEVWQISYWELTVRILFALVIGGLIGLEREMGDHAAGFRTHILVCLGSALIILLSIYGFSEFAAEANVRMDPARLAAQVVSGIGFLGAGTILRTGTTVSGLTTAASLWVVAALGLAVGAGFYYGAFIVTVLVFISLFLLNKLEQSFTKKKKEIEITVAVTDLTACMNPVTEKLRSKGAVIEQLAVEAVPSIDGETEASLQQIRFHLLIGKPNKLPTVITELYAIAGVQRVESQILETKVPKTVKLPFLK
ncbi:MgtC/SapB family protein [Paenibacillus thermotolerans]|uniref:MgtC/SapB family protein n=1 Tax=Paenibacillus thermotolerans TaxID=3027807 RepID=UPI002367734C|nr:MULTISPECIES: MgtC/SapB family protein [unclassified Paenibacillus]